MLFFLGALRVNLHTVVVRVISMLPVYTNRTLGKTYLSQPMRFFSLLGYVLALTSHQSTVKPILSSHSKEDQKLFFKTDYRLMQVKSIAECSKRAFCSTFDLH